MKLPVQMMIRIEIKSLRNFNVQKENINQSFYLYYLSIIYIIRLFFLDSLIFCACFIASGFFLYLLLKSSINLSNFYSFYSVSFVIQFNVKIFNCSVNFKAYSFPSKAKHISFFILQCLFSLLQHHLLSVQSSILMLCFTFSCFCSKSFAILLSL